jgi:hypothetical protein
MSLRGLQEPLAWHDRMTLGSAGANDHPVE